MGTNRFVPFERLLECVHCGLCLPACPTYVLGGNEADSPRGRIYLMRSLEDNELELNAGVVEHFDRCLGCLACETACPSGVRYRELIEHMRAAIEKHYQRPALERCRRQLLLALFPYPRRLAAALWPARILQRVGLGAWLRARFRWAALLPERWSRTRLACRIPAAGTERGSVALLTGCVAHAMFGDTHAALVRVLTHHGYSVHVPQGQGCCGALALHLGEPALATHLAERNLAAFASFDGPILVAAAGCGAALKDYGRLFAGTAQEGVARRFAARVQDATEFVASLDLAPATVPRHLRVAYQDACHLAHGQGIRHAPRNLLRRIAGVEIAEIAESDACCGSAGAFNLLEPQLASELGARKAAAIRDQKPDLVAVANPGCALQIGAALRRAGEPIPLLHPIEVYAKALDGSLASLASS